MTKIEIRIHAPGTPAVNIETDRLPFADELIFLNRFREADDAVLLRVVTIVHRQELPALVITKNVSQIEQDELVAMLKME